MISIKQGILLFLPMLILTLGCNQNLKKERWPNGKPKSEIHAVHDIYNGQATWWYENGGKQIECYYKNNLLDSLLTRWYDNGQKQEEQFYHQDKKDGRFSAWDMNGNLVSKGQYLHGLLDGPFREFYPNKGIKVDGQYKNGKFEGTWLYYNISGIVIGKGEFSGGNGRQISIFENGAIKSETLYKNNLREDTEKVYSPDGKLKEVRFFRNDKLEKSVKKYSAFSLFRM